MTRGGFHGKDRIIDPDRFAQLAKAKQVRFVMVGDLSYVRRRLGAEKAGKPITDWVRENGKMVDADLWQSSRLERRMSLYDLSPETLLIPVE